MGPGWCPVRRSWLVGQTPEAGRGPCIVAGGGTSVATFQPSLCAPWVQHGAEWLRSHWPSCGRRVAPAPTTWALQHTGWNRLCMLIKPKLSACGHCTMAGYQQAMSPTLASFVHCTHWPRTACKCKVASCAGLMCGPQVLCRSLGPSWQQAHTQAGASSHWQNHASWLTSQAFQDWTSH